MESRGKGVWERRKHWEHMTVFEGTSASRHLTYLKMELIRRTVRFGLGQDKLLRCRCGDLNRVRTFQGGSEMLWWTDRYWEGGGINGLEILIGLKNSALQDGQISEVERYQVWSENGMLTPELLNRGQLFPPLSLPYWEESTQSGAVIWQRDGACKTKQNISGVLETWGACEVTRVMGEDVSPMVRKNT